MQGQVKAHASFPRRFLLTQGICPWLACLASWHHSASIDALALIQHRSTALHVPPKQSPSATAGHTHMNQKADFGLIVNA